jgi:hypothetical protein
MKIMIFKKTDRTNKAFTAAMKAIVRELGKNATRDDLAELCLLLTHNCLTGNEQLSLEASSNNVNVFCSQLMALTNKTQKPGAGEPVGRLM